MTEYVWTHASLDTFLPDADNHDDVERLVETLVHGDPRDLITLTETGQAAAVAMIRKVAGKGYHVVNPDRGDITFLVRRDHRLIDAGGRLVVPAVDLPASQGGHGPRYNSHVRFDLDGEDLTHYGVHIVRHDPKGRDQRDVQLTQARAVGNAMRRDGRGSRLCTGSGDLNSVLPADRAMQRVFNECGLVTTAHETGVDTPTHGDRRIDYAWTRDADHRLEVTAMQVRRGAAWHSDHDPIDVTSTIRPPR